MSINVDSSEIDIIRFNNLNYEFEQNSALQRVGKQIFYFGYWKQFCLNLDDLDYFQELEGSQRPDFDIWGTSSVRVDRFIYLTGGMGDAARYCEYLDTKSL